MRDSIIGLAVTLALAAGYPTSGQAAEAYRPQIGQVHQEFALPTIGDGQRLKLSSLRGKKVLLVHFASW